MASLVLSTRLPVHKQSFFSHETKWMLHDKGILYAVDEGILDQVFLVVDNGVFKLWNKL